MQDENSPQRLYETPLHQLLSNPLDKLSDEELQEHVKHLRSVRTTAPAMAKQIESDEELPEKTRRKSTAKIKKADQMFDDLVKGLGQVHATL